MNKNNPFTGTPPRPFQIRPITVPLLAFMICLSWTNSAVADPFAYVANEGFSVSVIDTMTNSVVATIPTDGFARSVAVHPSGSLVYVKDFLNAVLPGAQHASQLLVIDATTNTIKEKVPLGSCANLIAIHPDGSAVYVPHRITGNGCGSNPLNGKVAVFDTASNTVVNSFSLGTGDAGKQLNPSDVAVHPNGTRLYVIHGDPDVIGLNTGVSVVEMGTFTVVTRISTPPLTGVAIHPAGTFVYVPHPLDDSVSVIDTLTNTVVTTIMVGDGPFGVAAHPDGTFVYVGNQGEQTVSVIDTSTNTVVATIPITGCCENLAVHPDGTFVYTANNVANTNTASVIDVASNTLVATIPVGSFPRDVALVRPSAIDIKPGSDPNCFNNDGHGVIPVAILSSVFFDATQVDPTTVTLDGQGVRVVGKGNTQAHIEDVNTDGLDDLIVQIEDIDGTFEEGEATATLTGETFDGISIVETDSICIVP